MKRILEGKRYDSDNAILIGEGKHGSVRSGDFSAWEAGLYKTPRSGQYFLAGEGGPMTQFRVQVEQNSWTSGSKVIPMTAQEAPRWAEQYLDSKVVEAEFGDLIKDA